MTTINPVHINTLEELTQRYLAFCEKNDLDTQLAPEEQYDLSHGQQAWINAHISRVTEAKLRDVASAKTVEGGDVVKSDTSTKTAENDGVVKSDTSSKTAEATSPSGDADIFTADDDDTLLMDSDDYQYSLSEYQPGPQDYLQ